MVPRSPRGAGDGTISLWNPANGQVQATLSGHQNEVTSLAFYPGAHQLASCSIDGTSRIWNLATRECQATIRPHHGPSLSVAISSDGQTLVTTGYKLSFWDALTGQERCGLGDGKGLSWCAAFSTDGKQLVSGYDNGVVRVRRAAPPDEARAPYD